MLRPARGEAAVGSCLNSAVEADVVRFQQSTGSSTVLLEEPRHAIRERTVGSGVPVGQERAQEAPTAGARGPRPRADRPHPARATPRWIADARPSPRILARAGDVAGVHGPHAHPGHDGEMGHTAQAQAGQPLEEVRKHARFVRPAAPPPRARARYAEPLQPPSQAAYARWVRPPPVGNFYWLFTTEIGICSAPVRSLVVVPRHSLLAAAPARSQTITRGPLHPEPRRRRHHDDVRLVDECRRRQHGRVRPDAGARLSRSRLRRPAVARSAAPAPAIPSPSPASRRHALLLSAAHQRHRSAATTYFTTLRHARATPTSSSPSSAIGARRRAGGAASPTCRTPPIRR